MSGEMPAVEPLAGSKQQKPTMEYFNNILCLPAHMYYHVYADGPGDGDVVEENYISYSAYKKQLLRGQINVVRKGKGEGNYALIELDSIPPKYRRAIDIDFPDPARAAMQNPIMEILKIDPEALRFYTNYRYPDGSPISTARVDNIKLWTNNASILNAVDERYKLHVAARAKNGKNPNNKEFFTNVATFLRTGDLKRFENNLPRNQVRLQEKFFEYRKISYPAFIKNLQGNSNAQKINEKLTNLLSFIAVLPTRPYNTKVVEIYRDFMAGKIELYDRKTGEEFIPEDYLDKDGNVVEFTESAFWQRIKQPARKVKIDKRRMGGKDFNDLHRPHRHRHAPEYSFSKISLDDRDLVWKDSGTKQRVKAYYAYDVASGCRIGSAYSMDKNEELFLDCLRDMFVFIDRNGFGIPLEVEVENHLVNKFFDDLAAMFPYLTVCAPGNSQEKRAEHFNRYVKYQVEKNNHPGIGRWWLKSKYNRVPVDRVGADFVQRMKPADKLIAEDILDTIEYNNRQHPNQKKYPGMTRMEVLIENQNPSLPQLNKQFIYRYIGYETETSIQRNQYVKVQYGKYMLPHPAVLERLASNNREVTAYYVPDEDGAINEVYLYQKGEFICTCERLDEYNEAKGERTDFDEAAKLKQDKYVAMFDKFVGEDEYAKLEIVKKQTSEVMPARVIKPAAAEVCQEPATDYAQKALDDFFN